MKQTVILSENELRKLISECIQQYLQSNLDEGKFGNFARSAALGAGLAGGMLGGINNTNAQIKIPLDGKTNKPSSYTRYTQSDLDNAIDSTYNVLRRGNTPEDDAFRQQMDRDIQAQMQGNIALKKYQDSIEADEIQKRKDSVMSKYKRPQSKITKKEEKILTPIYKISNRITLFEEKPSYVSRETGEIVECNYGFYKYYIGYNQDTVYELVCIQTFSNGSIHKDFDITESMFNSYAYTRISTHPTSYDGEIEYSQKRKAFRFNLDKNKHLIVYKWELDKAFSFLHRYIPDGFGPDNNDRWQR